MKIKQLIDKLSKLDPDENIEYDYITTSGVIELAKEQFNTVITKDEADTIIYIMRDGMDESQLQNTAWNDINDLLESKKGK